MSDKTPDTANDFNRSAMRLYGMISSATASTCISIFSLAMAVKADSSNWWYVGAAVFALGAAGAVYDTCVTIKQSMNPPNQGPK